MLMSKYKKNWFIDVIVCFGLIVYFALVKLVIPKCYPPLFMICVLKQ